MFIESIGRFLFKKIQLPLFLCILSICPLCVGFFLFMEKQSIDLLSSQLQIAQKKAKTAIQRKHRKELFVQRHSDPDPYFLTKQLETLSFLDKEKIELNNWLKHPAVSNKDPIINRIRYLESGGNALVFREEEIQMSKIAKETVEKQKQAIEIDELDLKRLLFLVEDLPSESLPLTQRPQLIISELSLHKKRTSLENQVLEFKMDLFKREFLSP